MLRFDQRERIAELSIDIDDGGSFVPNPKGASRTVELEEFFYMLRFDNRSKLEELGVDDIGIPKVI